MNKHISKPIWLEKFIDVYSQLNVDNVNRITEIYDADVIFEDPAHTLVGIDQLTEYFDNLYTNIIYCNFRIDEVYFQDEHAAIYWTMTFRHKQLNRNQPIEVQGHSKLKGEGSFITYHRDYIDLGAMIYEHIPVLGHFVKKLKARLSQ
jgi:hypothetical protein